MICGQILRDSWSLHIHVRDADLRGCRLRENEVTDVFDLRAIANLAGIIHHDEQLQPGSLALQRLQIGDFGALSPLGYDQIPAIYSRKIRSMMSLQSKHEAHRNFRGSGGGLRARLYPRNR